MKGETFTYSWVPESPAKLDRPQDANIQVVNLKSSWKPFQIVSPGNVLLKPYRTKERTYSIFEWWNHWPVAQVQSSGISAVAADKPSSSSLSHIEGQPYAQTSDSITKLLLDGLTTKPPADLLPLAKSWIAPPAMKLAGGPFQSEGYDPAQRAYVVTAGSAGKFHASFEASADSPLVNPAIVIKNWGDQIPRLKVNGKAVSWGPDFRVGQVRTPGRNQSYNLDEIAIDESHHPRSHSNRWELARSGDQQILRVRNMFQHGAPGFFCISVANRSVNPLMKCQRTVDRNSARQLRHAGSARFDG